MSRETVIVLSVLALVSPSVAAVTPLSIQRVVRVSVESESFPDRPFEHDEDDRSSIEFGSFENSLQVEVSGAGATAKQTSSVSPQQVSASGFAKANAFSIPGDITSAATAASTLRYEFSVDVDTPYQLEGYVQGILESTAVLPIDSHITLSDVDEVLFNVTSAIFTEPELRQGMDTVHFSYAGTLSPGVYTIDAIADQELRRGAERVQTGSYEFTLTFVPEPTSITSMLLGTLWLAVARRRRIAMR